MVNLISKICRTKLWIQSDSRNITKFFTVTMFSEYSRNIENYKLRLLPCTQIPTEKALKTTTKRWKSQNT